jgi:hypothetical protein
MAKLYSKNTWLDEVLAAAERYNINNNAGGSIYSNVAIALLTSVVQAGTAVDAAHMNNIENGIDAIDTLLNTVNTNLGSNPQGGFATLVARLAAVDTLTALLAPKASPALTGTPTAPTPAAHLNNTQLATTAYVENQDGWQLPPFSIIVWDSSNKLIALNTTGTDYRYMFPVGTKIKFTQDTIVKYFYVIANNYGSGVTTLTLSTSSDFTLTANPITFGYYSYASTPQGFPQWFSWAPTFTGYSGAVSGTKLFSVNGNTCFLILDISGTSNANTLTMTLPVTPSAGGSILTRTYDTGAVSTSPGFISVIATNPIASVYPLLSGGTWTASGNKGCLTDGFYRI